jgi:hypothetical protein
VREGKRNGAGGQELRLHIGRVVAQPGLQENIGSDRAQCAERIATALRRRFAADPVPNESITTADKVAHAIWDLVNPIIQGAERAGMRSSDSTLDGALRLDALGDTGPRQVSSTPVEPRSEPQRAGNRVTQSLGREAKT